MKNISKISLLAFTALAIVLSSCSKYEEGNVSLASKKSRLVNHWKTKKITADGYDITGLNIITEVEIFDNNKIDVYSGSTVNHGAWVFNPGKTAVLVTNNDGSLTNYEIVMLQKDELKVRTTNDDGVVFLHHYITY
jgi:hypothetical protein